MNALLEVEHLGVQVEDKLILRDVSMKIGKGETHVLMGPNGAGKSTLGYALMGSPEYRISSGRIIFKGEEITESPVDQRAKAGLFLSFQEPLAIPGLSLENFLRSAWRERTEEKLNIWGFQKKLYDAMQVLQMDYSYAFRDLNVGFSGGEKKKAEILQMLLFKPELAILDETDSGLDVDAVRLVSEGVRTYQKEAGGALLIITHSTRILDALHIDYTHVIVDGQIVATGDSSLVEQINREGYEPFLK